MILDAIRALSSKPLALQNQELRTLSTTALKPKRTTDLLFKQGAGIGVGTLFGRSCVSSSCMVN